MTTAAIEPRKLTKADVKNSAAVLFDLDPTMSLWQDADGLTFISKWGTFQYPGWKLFADEFSVAKQDIIGGVCWDAEQCWAYGRLPFEAAAENLKRKELEQENAKDTKQRADDEYVAERRAAEAATRQRSNGVPAGHDGQQPVQQPGTVARSSRIELRDYQQRGVRQLSEAIVSGKRRILLVGPTGMGKMVLAAYLMEGASAKGNPSMFVADMRELVGQCVSKLQGYGLPVKAIMAGDDTWERRALATVASKDTLFARAFRNDKIDPPQCKMLICDEAHRSLAPTWDRIITHYGDSGALVCGMTATPSRMDGRGLGDVYDAMVVVATYKELRDAGWIVGCKVYAPTKPDLKGVHVARGDYVRKELEQRMNAARLVGDIVQDWRKRAEGRITFAFGAGVHHSVHIRNQFRRHGVSAEHVDSKNTKKAERDDIFGRFFDGKVTVLCTYGVGTTGLDMPDASCVILARPTKSFVLYRQMCGRGLRSAPGKRDLIVLDHSGAVFRHGFPDDDVEWELSESANIQEKMKEKIKKERLEGKEPYACPECATAYRGPECPSCGHRPALREKQIEMEKGELREVERASLNKETDIKQKEKDWKGFVGICIKKGHAMKVAAGMYKSKYGVFPPNGFDLTPRGKAQWHMDAKKFYELYQNHKMFGKENV